MKYLLDTDICIYVLKHRYLRLVEKLRRVGIENVGVTTITLAELEYGVANSQKPAETTARLYEFLAPFSFLDFDADSARHYGGIRKTLKDQGRPIGPMDILIASVALAHDRVLVTNNIGEFTRVPGLKIENWAA